MPLYEYKCANCGQHVEILQRVSDKPYTHCPKCGGEMKKLISSPAIQFKGPGFYKTDYASKPESREPKSEAKSETKSEAKSESSGSKSGAGSD